MSAALSTCPHWCELTPPHQGDPHSVKLSEDARLGVDLVVQEDGAIEVMLWIDGNSAELRPPHLLTSNELETMSATLVEAASRLRELQESDP